MHLEFFLEEPSAEAALEVVVPRVVGPAVTFQFHPHQGKQDLLAVLPNRLRAYASWLPADWRIVVLIDEDRQDCHILKAQLEDIAQAAHLVTKSVAAVGQSFQVLNRIAIEELEAWFFGDVEALRQAYPRLPRSLGRRARYRDPDGIHGGTCEALERVLQEAGYYRGGLSKIAAARDIARHMDPTRNASRSFQVFRAGLLRTIA